MLSIEEELRLVLALHPCCCYLVAQSCLTLCDAMDCSLPGSSVHGILQARILGWVAISFSRGVFPARGLNPHLLHWQASSLPLSHPRSPCPPPPPPNCPIITVPRKRAESVWWTVTHSGTLRISHRTVSPPRAPWEVVGKKRIRETHQHD